MKKSNRKRIIKLKEGEMPWFDILPYIWASIASLIFWFLIECVMFALQGDSEIIVTPPEKYEIIQEDLSSAQVPEEIEVLEVSDNSLDEETFEYLARCVEAEAGNQPELGKRMVCSVVLNRYDQGDYDNIIEVINAPGQFSVVSDGRIHKVTPTEETYDVVKKELESRTNELVLYFRADKYHSFGIPMFVIGDHYFSM